MQSGNELMALVPALVLFCFAAAFTPGPNNILLTRSGAHFGVKQTLPHIIGIRVGMSLIHIAMLLGLGTLFLMVPTLHVVLQILASCYIVFLAYKIWHSGVPLQQNSDTLKPMTMRQAALFQLINPKSISMILSLCSALTLPGELFWYSAILGLIIFNIVGVSCALFWVCTGKYISRYLHSATHVKRFNSVMALLLMTCLPLIFI